MAMKIRFLMALSLLVTLSAYGAGDEPVQKFELDVKDFSQLVVDDGLNVEYHSNDDMAGKAVFSAPKSIADKILFENNGKGKLLIQKSFHEETELVSDLPTIKVYSRFLKSITNNGDSTVRALEVRPTMEMNATVVGNGRLVVRDVDCSKFSGSIKTGNGTLVVTGKCAEAVLSNTGTGAIQADNLRAGNVSCRFFGTGTTGCWATGTLTVKGMMKGKLYYRDTPARIRNFSVGVKIYSLEGTEWLGEQEPDPDGDSGAPADEK